MSKWFKWGVLWLGLGLCFYAFWQAPEQAKGLFISMSGQFWGAVALLLLLIWGLAVISWRSYLFAYTGQRPTWRTAIRQLGLLLVGKYLPGGVFGFLARVYDQPQAERKSLVWAGLVEQAVGVAMPVAIGAILYGVARQQQSLWLCLLLALPVLAAACGLALQSVSAHLPWLRRYTMASRPSFKLLLAATVLHFLQLMLWATLVMLLAQQIFSLDAFAAMGVAAAFLLAVAVGMLIVLAPGGIGAREAALFALSSQWLGAADALLLTAFLRLLTSALDVFAGLLAVLPDQKEAV